MKKKKNTKLLVKDFIVVLTCCSGILISLYSYYADVNTSLLRQDKDTVAYITYKHKSVQRRFEDRVIWDRVRQKSPLYAGDVIRTAPASEATITFESGSEITMSEITLIQIFAGTHGEELFFQEGSIIVKSAGTTRLKSGDNVVTLKAGTTASGSVKRSTEKNTDSQTEENGKFTLALQEGEAIVENSSGASKISAGEIYAAAPNGVFETQPVMIMLEPGASVRAARSATQEAVIPFSWKLAHATGNETVRIEFYDRKTSSQPISFIETSAHSLEAVQTQLPEGVFYWRAFLENEVSVSREIFATGTITIFSQPEQQNETILELPPSLAQAQNEIITVMPETPPETNFIPLQIASVIMPEKKEPPVSTVIAQEIQKSTPQKKAPPTVKNRTQPPAQNVLPPKTSVQVSQKTKSQEQNLSRDSENLSQISVKKSLLPLAAPEVLLPQSGTIFRPQELTSGKILFSWKSVEDAKNYVFSLYTSQNQKIFEQRVQGTFISLTDLHILDRGEFIWKVKGEASLKTADLPREAHTSVATFTVDLPQIQLHVQKPEPTIYNEIPGKITFINPDKTVYADNSDIEYTQETATQYTQENAPVYTSEQTPAYSREADIYFSKDDSIKYTDEQITAFTNEETEYVR